MKKEDTSIAIKIKTKDDFDKGLKAKMAAIFGNLSYDSIIKKLNEHADEIIEILVIN